MTELDNNKNNSS